MARSDTRFRQAHNAFLDSLTRENAGYRLPSELQMSHDLSVSRTVVRAILSRLVQLGLIKVNGREKTLLRSVRQRDQLPLLTEYLGRDDLESRFLNWILRFDVPAGTTLNVTQLARQFNVAPYHMQEFLSSLGQTGLIERKSGGGWTLLGFTRDYAEELSDFRLVLETNAVRAFAKLPPDHAAWEELGQLRAAHQSLLARIAHDYHDFSPLDERFHAVVQSAVQNRFFAQFQKTISLIFHYHYQWDKTMERHRNEAAIAEHLAIMTALLAGDADAAERALVSHLRTSKQTLVSSLRDHRLG